MPKSLDMELAQGTLLSLPRPIQGVEVLRARWGDPHRAEHDGFPEPNCSNCSPGHCIRLQPVWIVAVHAVGCCHPSPPPLLQVHVRDQALGHLTWRALMEPATRCTCPPPLHCITRNAVTVDNAVGRARAHPPAQEGLFRPSSTEHAPAGCQLLFVTCQLL